MRARSYVVASFAGALMVARAAAAQPAAASPGAADVPATPAAPSADDARAAAHVHFDKGLAASNDQRFGEAAAEFEKAHELWPDYRVLYNIGKVRVALGRFAEAVDAWEAYLDQGGVAIGDDRRKEVTEAVTGALAHVAALTVRVAPEGAEVRLDGRLIGVSPLAAPLRVTEGKHTVEALLPGRPVQLRELELPGASTLDVALDFPLAAPLDPAPPPIPPAVLVDKVPAREPPRHWRAISSGVAGAGLVAVAVGAVIAYEGAQDANAARARLVVASEGAMGSPPDAGKYDAAKLSFDDAKTRNELGWALVGFGAAAIVAGGTLAFVWSGSSAGVRGSW
jgi:tetratricopeptide (TPR) repeat protein